MKHKALFVVLSMMCFLLAACNQVELEAPFNAVREEPPAVVAERPPRLSIVANEEHFGHDADNGYNGDEFGDNANDYEACAIPLRLQGVETAIPVFPSLHITADGVPFVDRDLWISSTFTLEGTLESLQFENVEGRIRGRGNSTWRNAPSKRPLRIRFGQAQSVMGVDAVSRDWILLTNHFDGTLMRNHAAFYFASLLEGLDWTPSSHFVHLYVNERYMGVYQLTDEREAHPDRIPLNYDPDPTVSEYLLELDRNNLNNSSLVAGVDLFHDNLRTYRLRWPSADAGSGHFEYAQFFVRKTNEAIRSRDFYAISQVIDIPSFVDAYLVHELFCQVGIGWFSVWMSIRGQGEERRIVMGPVWDFDQSAGNATTITTPDSQHSRSRSTAQYSPDGLFVTLYNHWFRDLMQTPEFFYLVAVRWEEIRDKEVEQTLEHIQDMLRFHGECFDRNFERHPILGRNLYRSPTSVARLSTHEEHTMHLVDWLDERRSWMDGFLAGT
jgi:hypothetical protein